jgi:phosphatidate cytidylyltransferase
MTHDPANDPTEGAPGEPGKSGMPGEHGATQRSHENHSEFKAQVKATRADIERQVRATRAQLDATNERIEARTGRNLISAILIGLGFGLLMLFSLIFIKQLFMVVATATIVFAVFELTQALRAAGRNVPRIPTILAAVAIVPSAYYWHSTGQLIAIGAGILFVWLWRLAQALAPASRVPGSKLISDLGAAALIQIYVAFLSSFAMLLLSKNGGQWWTLAFLIIVITIDIGAYATGLSFGKHPMAPTISPKKTWEGFAGAGATSVVAGILLSVFMLHEPWWFGVILGLVLLFTATIGDLAESLIKRDLGIKDMSSWLPGHGGFLDRLDSILPSAAATYALFLIFR